MNEGIFTTAYLPNIQYFSKIFQCDKISIELFENYSKQTYRNRCEIFAANGKLSLSIPIVKYPKQKTLIKNIRIDHDTNWQKNHWKSIESAYNSSPFFEFYADDFAPFYKKKYNFLIDYNLDLTKMLLTHLNKKTEIEKTNNFIKKSNNINDFRFSFHPKKHYNKKDSYFVPFEYNQVFKPKFGFMANLSIIDLLFNEGPNSTIILKKCIRKGNK